MDSYESLIEVLASKGLNATLDRPDQLVVSTQRGPVWPDGGCSFWLSFQNSTWYLCGWAPECYRIPSDQDVVLLCTTCMETGTRAMFRVPEQIVSRFALERLDDHAFEQLFPCERDEDNE